jgi:hypothetical protein
MNRMIPIMSLLISLAVADASADEAAKPTEMKRIPAHNPEWTDARGSDPGTTESVVPELQGIVVLCATQPQSVEFKKQWADYVRGTYKPGMNIDAVINDVIRRAGAYRARQRKGTISTPARAVKPNEETKKMMHDTAKAIIQNMRA